MGAIVLQHADLGAGVEDEELGGGLIQAGAHRNLFVQYDALPDVGGFVIVEQRRRHENHRRRGDGHGGVAQAATVGHAPGDQDRPEEQVEDDGQENDGSLAETVFPEEKDAPGGDGLIIGGIPGQGAGVVGVEPQVGVIGPQLQSALIPEDGAAELVVFKLGVAQVVVEGAVAHPALGDRFHLLDGFFVVLGCVGLHGGDKSVRIFLGPAVLRGGRRPDNQD